VQAIDILNGPVVLESLGVVSNSAHGATVYFLGRVRGENHGRKVKGVHYECFRPLSITMLERIRDEASDRWGKDLEISVVHGTGYMRIGELSVVVGVSSPHRAEAFEACRYVIEQLKARVPIWKKEVYEDGETEWLRGYELCQHEHTLSEPPRL
jgi:molybdopterin synthase catalytic subunit